MKFSNYTNIKNIEDLLVNNTEEYMSESDEPKPHKFSEYSQNKYLCQNLNSMHAFLPSLVMLFVGSQLKILRMSWYSSMKPFKTNLNLSIKKYLLRWHQSLPEVDHYSNDTMLSVMSKYIYYYNFNSNQVWIYVYIYLLKWYVKY